jgi:DNA-binding response OmpR family regulator
MTNTRETPSSSERGESSKAPRPLRIVIADDDRDTVLTLMMVLRHEGHEVRGVYRGWDVLTHVKDFDPDVVLADINMPEMNGYQVARAVRTEYGDRRPLLIGISGVYKNDSDKILGQLAGFDHYLTKPYEPSDILRLIAPLRYPRGDSA